MNLNATTFKKESLIVSFISYLTKNDLKNYLSQIVSVIFF
jgi:hypothetical protein